MKQNKENITKEMIGDLKQQEIDLLYLLRHRYRFGTIEIVMRDGLPFDILKTVERTRLGELSPEKVDNMA